MKQEFSPKLALCEQLHYESINNTIIHKPVRGPKEYNNKTSDLNRKLRETFNFYHCQNFRCNNLANHPTSN